jgi:hypothetical protein
MRSEPPAQDLTALDVCVRDAAASMPECGGARRELAGVAPGRRSRPLTRPHDSTKHRGDACARDRGVREGDRASPAAGAGRGRSGRSDELVSAPKCTRRRETGRGLMLTVRKRRSELEIEGDATAVELGNGSGSGGVPAWSRRDSHGPWGREPTATRA